MGRAGGCTSASLRGPSKADLVPARLLPLTALLAAAPRPARAWDPFNDARVPPHFELHDGELRLALKGELAMSVHDLEGEGGPGKDSVTDTRTIGTRSPYVELSGFTLAPRLTLAPGLAVNTQLAFGPTDARVAASWLDAGFETGPVGHHVEAGFRPPFANRDPRATREPLAGTVYWSAPEMHLAWEAGQTFEQTWGWSAGLSVGVLRPLGFAPVQASRAQRGTINVLAYDPGRVYSGNGPTYGARARVTAWGAYLEAFGFVGELAREAGTDELRASLAGYGAQPGAEDDRTARWFGGRLGYEGHGLHALVEGVAGEEGVLQRRIGDAQISYRLALLDGPWWRAIEPLVRYDLLRIRDSEEAHGGTALRSPSLSQAATWDWTVLTAGLSAEVFRELLLVRLEYDHITEENDVPALGIAGTDFRNDELRAELLLRF